MVGVDYGWDRIDVGGIARANRLLIEHWDKGGLVTGCMHPGNPCVADGTVHGVDGIDLGAVLTTGSEANRRWMTMLATVADGLDELRRYRWRCPTIQRRPSCWPRKMSAPLWTAGRSRACGGRRPAISRARQ